MDSDGAKFKPYFFEQCKTLYDVLPHGSTLTEDKKCLAVIDKTKNTLSWITYDEVAERVKHFADGLIHLGLAPASTLGFYSGNCPEYFIAENACHRHSIVVVPIYETQDMPTCAYIANQVECSTLFCDTNDRTLDILNNHEHFKLLKQIIIGIDASNQFDVLSLKAKTFGINCFLMSTVEKLGAENPQLDNPPSVNDLAVIIYTSGTVGMPKGVMLTHENIVCNFCAAMYLLKEEHFRPSDILISYLPLGHILEREFEYLLLSVGGKVAYFSGDLKRLPQDLAIIRPTIFPCVPRVLNKMYFKIWDKAKRNWFQMILLKFALRAKRRQLRKCERFSSSNRTLWDRLIFSRISALLGGKVRIIVSGSAPLDEKVFDFVRCAFQCMVVNAYGQTECSGACTSTIPHDSTASSHVGFPLETSCVIKLFDVPEMGYYSAKSEGEIGVKGPIVFQGYFKNPEKTKEVLTDDGYLLTGDIGHWNTDGTIRIIDRKRDIFKLSQGEFIAPAKIEGIYARCPYISQIYVHGDSLKSSLVAIVVPDLVAIAADGFSIGQTAEEMSFSPNEILTQIKNEQLMQNRGNETIKAFLMQEFEKLEKNSKLKSYEKLRNIYVHFEEFSVENGLLTPSYKNKRQSLRKVFQTQIEKLYDALD